GRRRATLVVGMTVVTVGGVLTVLPAGFTGLLVGRTLQGVGLGLMPLAMAVARETISPLRRSQVIGLLSVANVAGAGLGYPAAAFAADRVGVIGGFSLSLCLSVVTLVLTFRAVPKSRGGRADRVDLLGALLLGGGVGGLLVALSKAAAWG